MASSAAKEDGDLTSEEKLSLQIKELQEAAVLRESELAKLRVEMDCMRVSEKAADDRMNSFYRDVQKFQQDNRVQPSEPTKTADSAGSARASSQQQKVEKYERMLRIMNNQIMLVRSSSDDLAKSLKDQLKDAMNEKVQSDLKRLHIVRDLEDEKRGLLKQLEEAKTECAALKQHQSTCLTRNGNPSQPPQPPRRHKSKDDDDQSPTEAVARLKEDLKRQRIENEQLRQAVNAATGQPKSDSTDSSSIVDSLQRTIDQLTMENKRLESERSSAPQRPRRHKSIDEDVDIGTIDLLKEDLVRLRAENEQLKQSTAATVAQDSTNGGKEKHDDMLDSLNSSIQRLMIENKHLETELANKQGRENEMLAQWTIEKASLLKELDSLARKQPRTPFSQTETERWIEQSRTAAMEQLDRVALLWDRADESVQGLESTVSQLRSLASSHNSIAEGTEQMISVHEVAMLVHSQIKISLMLIELKLRNNMTCLELDAPASFESQTGQAQLEGNELDAAVQKIQCGALDALRDLEAIAGEQVKSLRSKLYDNSYTDTGDQEMFGEDMSQFQDFGVEQSTSIDMLISHEALETLQNEVLQVVERVKDKNETIDRLTAQIEEFQVRERSLMEELKRHMQDQADRQLVEHQRLMQQQQNLDVDNSDGVDGGSYEDGSSVYEEKTVDEGYFCEEVTIYDEETVV